MITITLTPNSNSNTNINPNPRSITLTTLSLKKRGYETPGYEQVRVQNIWHPCVCSLCVCVSDSLYTQNLTNYRS